MAAKPQPVQNEPFEIVEEAIDQITGARLPQETQPSGQGQQPPFAKASGGKQAQPGLDEKKKVVILTAHRRELDEITQLQKKRQEEMRARWSGKTEIEKETGTGQEVQKPLVEPTPKPKSGIFGGMLGNLRKKQRSVELPKTPTN